MSTIQLRRVYGGVCLLTSMVAGEYLLLTHLERLQRMSTYDAEYMQMNFQAEHYREVGDDPAWYGYPDDGNGKYTRFKGYPDWYFMNIAKRQAANNTENLVTLLPLSLVNGAVFPKTTMLFLSSYLVGRYLYAEGYNRKEGAANQLRMIGAATAHSVTCATLILSLFIGVRMS